MTIQSPSFTETFKVTATPQSAFVLPADFYVFPNTVLKLYKNGVDTPFTWAGNRRADGVDEGGTATISPAVTNTTITLTAKHPVHRLSDMSITADVPAMSVNHELDYIFAVMSGAAFFQDTEKEIANAVDVVNPWYAPGDLRRYTNNEELGDKAFLAAVKARAPIYIPEVPGKPWVFSAHVIADSEVGGMLQIFGPGTITGQGYNIRVDDMVDKLILSDFTMSNFGGIWSQATHVGAQASATNLHAVNCEFGLSLNGKWQSVFYGGNYIKSVIRDGWARGLAVGSDGITSTRATVIGNIIDTLKPIGTDRRAIGIYVNCGKANVSDNIVVQNVDTADVDSRLLQAHVHEHLTLSNNQLVLNVTGDQAQCRGSHMLVVAEDADVFAVVNNNNCSLESGQTGPSMQNWAMLTGTTDAGSDTLECHAKQNVLNNLNGAIAAAVHPVRFEGSGNIDMAIHGQYRKNTAALYALIGAGTYRVNVAGNYTGVDWSAA